MLTPAAAESLILAQIALLPAEDCPLAQAHGRILRLPLLADRDFPSFDRVTMDGYALRHAVWAAGRHELQIAATQHAGDPGQTLASTETCIEVMTGAMLPVGTDTVVPYEEAQRAGEIITLRSGVEIKRGQAVHRRGSDHRAGELIVAEGTRLGGGEIAVAATCGAATLRVTRRARISVVATGTELVETGSTPAPHQIRRSNDYALAAALALAGHPQVERWHLPDAPAELTIRLRPMIEGFDAVVLCGGVSAGRRDFLPRVLEELGVRKIFHGVAQRPGKPLWFGVIPAGVPVFALPGNPVSAYTCLHRYVLPALEKMCGTPPAPPQTAALSLPFDFRPKLACLLPVKIRSSPRAERLADPMPTNTSGDFAGLIDTDGFVELPAEIDEFPAGYVAQFRPWV